MYTFRDKWARIIGIPSIGLIITLLTHEDRVNQATLIPWECIIVSTLFTSIFWEGNRYIFLKTINLFPTYQQVKKRLFLQCLLSLAFTLAGSVLLLWVLVSMGMDKGFTWKEWRNDFLICLIPTVMVSTLYECVYYFEQWKQNIQQTEALARENIQSQFEALKHQTDPHFLFNSLNTLAALIDEENEPAQKYLEQLSDVYRYVLLCKDKTTVTLEEEMNFVNAYLYLCKTRFRENLRIETILSPSSYTCHLPALSLQLLVENAIKHNVISKDKPLCIRIFEEEDCITIENNIQEKTILEKSTKVGLQNIINRYSFLTSRKIEILRKNEMFRVTIPLLAIHQLQEAEVKM